MLLLLMPRRALETRGSRSAGRTFLRISAHTPDLYKLQSLEMALLLESLQQGDLLFDEFVEIVSINNVGDLESRVISFTGHKVELSS